MPVCVCVLSGNNVLSVGTSVYLQTSPSVPLMTSGQSLVLQEGICGAEGRTAMSPGNSSMLPKNTGATVHHLGPTDPRESPFAHLRSQLQTVAMQEPSRPSASIKSEQQLSSELITDPDVQACKRIKLEPSCNVSSLSSSPLFYQTLYVNSREHELMELHSSYQDHITELFFLENNGNLMDYLAWSKRPNVHLSRLLQSANLDSIDEPKAEDEVCYVRW